MNLSHVWIILELSNFENPSTEKIQELYFFISSWWRCIFIYHKKHIDTDSIENGKPLLYIFILETPYIKNNVFFALSCDSFFMYTTLSYSRLSNMKFFISLNSCVLNRIYNRDFIQISLNEITDFFRIICIQT